MRCLFFLLVAVLPLACQPAAEAPEAELTPHAQVSVSKVSIKAMSEQVHLTASSVYLQRNVITAPVPAFITGVFIKLGDHVKKGMLLYTLETKERRAIGNQQISSDTTLSDFGRLVVRAPADGVISTLDKQQTGDYVLEGNPLCTIAESGNLAFQLNVPYEYHQYVTTHTLCTITLPDKRSFPAEITTPLSAMNTLAQTETYLVKPSAPVYLPENLIATVSLNTRHKNDAQVVPRSAVQADETLEHFWVMKLINDSIAVRTAVQTGMQNDEQVEIVSPVFSGTDRIISSGAYGLADTAFINIQQ